MWSWSLVSTRTIETWSLLGFWLCRGSCRSSLHWEIVLISVTTPFLGHRKRNQRYLDQAQNLNIVNLPKQLLSSLGYECSLEIFASSFHHLLLYGVTILAPSILHQITCFMLEQNISRKIIIMLVKKWLTKLLKFDISTLSIKLQIFSLRASLQHVFIYCETS